jgi:formylglycine-generating enzyme required for sulfatase activity
MNRYKLCYPMIAALAFGLSLAMVDGLRADTFGSGDDVFTVDFVTVANAGNADDAGAVGGVNYTYRMGVYEISQHQIAKASNAGVTHVSAGAWVGDQPAANITWYEAAAFVNWLNTSTGHQAAYSLTYSGEWSMSLWGSGEAWQLGGENLYRHKNAYYFLPSEDEWYKAAYHKNDGVSANYWAYATASDTAPTPVPSGMAAGTAVYDGAASSPAATNNNGGLSPYGTMGQNGNVSEWTESASDGLNHSPLAYRTLRGGYWFDASFNLLSAVGSSDLPTYEYSHYGFRVAAIPEPSAAPVAVTGLVTWMFNRRRKPR